MATVLVVDDEMGIRELLSEILGDEGHQVELAENAQQARDYRNHSEPDLVLLDIWMPDTDGVTLLKEWASQGLLTMPVVMMSGHGTIDTAVEATRIGALNFLEKPIALQKLLKTVEQALAKPSHTPVTPINQPTHQPISGSGLPLQVNEANPEGEAAAASIKLMAQLSYFGTVSLDMYLRDARDAFEKVYFEYHLGQENGSMTRVAEKTGLERTHLYRKLKQLGIDLNKSERRRA